MRSNPPTTPEQRDEYVRMWLGGFRSEKTVEGYGRDIVVYFRWLDTEGLTFAGARRADADRYRMWLEQESVSQSTGRPLAPSTIARRIDAVASLYVYLVREELFDYNPFAAVRRPGKDRESRTVGLTAEGAGRLLDTAAAQPNPIEHALVWLFLATGLRLAEVQQANLSNLHIGGYGTTLSVRCKGDRPNLMAIPGPAADALQRYLAVREDSDTDAIFVRHGQRIERAYIRSMLKRLCRAAGVPAISVHGLRHTCATLMLDSGASLGDVQMQLGHRSLETTLRYDRARRRRADLAGNALTKVLVGHMN